jgi:hypothetical protein
VRWRVCVVALHRSDRVAGFPGPAFRPATVQGPALRPATV